MPSLSVADAALRRDQAPLVETSTWGLLTRLAHSVATAGLMLMR
jgi:hypothetical protein